MTASSGSMDGAGAPTTLPTASARETWRSLRVLARPHKLLIGLATVVLVTATGAALVIPRLLGAIVDVVNDGGPASDVDGLALALVAATVAQGSFGGLGSLLVGRIGEQLLAGLREQVVDRALHVPLGQVERAGTGDLVARACGDVDTVSEATREAFPEIISSALIIGLTAVGLAALDWRLAVAGLVAVPIQASAGRWYMRRSGPIYADERAAEGARSQQLHSSVAGAHTVRAFRLEDAHLDGIDRSSRKAIGYTLAAAQVRAWFASRLNLAELVGLSSVLVAGFLLVRNGSITLGAATAAALYFHRLFDPIGALLFQLDAAQSAVAALARLVGVASLPAPTPAPAPTPSPIPAAAVTASRARLEAAVNAPLGAAVEPSAGDASVHLEGVRFAYDGGDEVLHGVDLQLAPGERVALVGPSGAGKTTIAKLVAGVHTPTEGTVRIAGPAVGALSPGSPDGAGPDVTEAEAASTVDLDGNPAVRTPRRAVVLVSQEVHVFSGSLADDLRMARPGASEGDLLAALEQVGAAGWVQTLPDGLETVVSEGQHQLGPTEAQQLALARLLLADPAIAILDEATAEAGSAGARKLEAAARAAVAGRTSLVIAHRLTQAVAADRIVVLDKGRVVEQGTHEELLAAAGPYADLWSAWSTPR